MEQPNTPVAKVFGSISSFGDDGFYVETEAGESWFPLFALSISDRERVKWRDKVIITQYYETTTGGQVRNIVVVELEGTSPTAGTK